MTARKPPELRGGGGGGEDRPPARDVRVVIAAIVLAVGAVVGLCILTSGFFRAVWHYVHDFVGTLV
jgi:hypothetical protein